MSLFNRLFGRRSTTSFPKITFELHTNVVQVIVDWPDGENSEQKANIGGAVATMLYYINDGQMLALIQQAVAVTGTLKGDERLSQHILNIFHKHVISGGADDKSPAAEDGAVVSCDDVFTK